MKVMLTHIHLLGCGCRVSPEHTEGRYNSDTNITITDLIVLSASLFNQYNIMRSSVFTSAETVFTCEHIDHKCD